MTDCVVCGGSMNCEFCPKVTREEEVFASEALLTVLLWDIAFWLALVVLIGWLT